LAIGVNFSRFLRKLLRRFSYPLPLFLFEQVVLLE